MSALNDSLPEHHSSSLNKEASSSDEAQDQEALRAPLAAAQLELDALRAMLAWPAPSERLRSHDDEDHDKTASRPNKENSTL